MADTHLGLLRTRMSLERTLMAGVRTSVALIALGFVIEFFNRTHEVPGVNPVGVPEVPYYLGLSLIFCGVLALVMSIWQYESTLHYLWSGSFAAVGGITKGGKLTPLIVVSVVLIFIGTFAFFVALLHFI
jgi:putative membrane protein